MKILLYSVDSALRSAIRKEFANDKCEVLEITDSSSFGRAGINEQRQEGTMGRLELPDVVDLVVTRSALNSKTEGLAATLGLKQGRRDVYPVVIPEGLPFLRQRLEAKGSLTLVGADQAK